MAGFAGLTNVQRKQQPCILPFATGTAADGVLQEEQTRNIRWSQARDAEAGRSTMKAFHIRFGSMLVEEVASFAAGEPVWFHSTVKRSLAPFLRFEFTGNDFDCKSIPGFNGLRKIRTEKVSRRRLAGQPRGRDADAAGRQARPANRQSPAILRGHGR